MPWYSVGILVVSGVFAFLKLILYLDPLGAPYCLKSLEVVALTILYLSVGNVGSAACVWNCIGLFNLPASTSSLTNFLIVEASRSIPCSANFLDI